MKTDGATLPPWSREEPGDGQTRVEAGRLAVRRLYRSEAHNYFGHHQRPPGAAPMMEEERVELVAGQGIVGDRFFGYREGYRGQVTFFAEETWSRLRAELGHEDRTPAVFRRNVITQGIDLLSLVGETFEVQGVRFSGTEHCKPCHWMDEAFGPGTLERLARWKAGGLRAKVLDDGWLSTTPGGKP